MYNFANSRVFLVIAIMVLGAGSVSAESDDVAGRSVVGAPGPSAVQVDCRATLTTLFSTPAPNIRVAPNKGIPVENAGLIDCP